MRRRRTVVVQQQNGGRHCPQLEQLRGCQVNNCHHHQDTAVRGEYKNINIFYMYTTRLTCKLLVS